MNLCARDDARQPLLIDDEPSILRRMLSASEARTIVCNAIIKANNEYERATQGVLWLSDCAGEHLIVAEAWRELADAHRGGYAVVEMAMSNLKFGAIPGSLRRGPPPSGLRASGRCDIALLDCEQRVHALIEIKRAQGRHLWLADLDRLCHAQNRHGSKTSPGLRFGLLGAYVAGWSEAVFERNYRQVQVLVHSLQQRHDNLILKMSPRRDPTIWHDGNWRFAPVAISIETR